MTDPRRQRFAPYLRRLADLLGLKDWHVRIADEAADACADASIEWTYGRKRARVWLGEHFLDDTPEGQRHTLAHELIHCHFGPAWDIAVEGLADAAASPFRRLAEYAVDGLADAIAPLLPLPDAPE